jgi:hypothetical protein
MTYTLLYHSAAPGYRQAELRRSDGAQYRIRLMSGSHPRVERTVRDALSGETIVMVLPPWERECQVVLSECARQGVTLAEEVTDVA